MLHHTIASVQLVQATSLISAYPAILSQMKTRRFTKYDSMLVWSYPRA